MQNFKGCKGPRFEHNRQSSYESSKNIIEKPEINSEERSSLSE